VRAFAKAPSAGSTTHGNGSTFSFGVLAAILACAAAFLGIGAPAASAATAIDSYAYLSTFGEGGGYPLGPQGNGVAVDQDSGTVFFAYQNLGMWIYPPDPNPGDGTLVNPENSSGHLVQNVAVDSATDAVYVSDTYFGPGVFKLVSDGAPTPTYTFEPAFAPDPSLLVSPDGLAVDPSTHDVLVADRGAAKVYRFDSSDGSLIASFDGSSNPGGGFQTPNSVVVSPAGDFYVNDVGAGRVDYFASDGSWLGQLPLPAGSSPQSVAVNPVNSEVAVLDVRDRVYIDAFSAAGTATFSSFLPSNIDSATAGIAWDGSRGRIYVNTGNNSVNVFAPAILAGVDPPEATAGRNTAHVTAEVAPGGESTTAWIEYCPSTASCDNYPAFGGSPTNPWKRGPAHEGLTADTTIEDDLPLYSNATWRLRVTAENSKLSNTSSPTTLASPLLVPGVETQGATSVTETSAELTGTIDPIGDPTTYHFEFGETAAYGAQVPLLTEAPAGNNRQPRTVAQTISGLQSKTTYHYRLVATNSAGEAFGADRTFTTLGSTEAAPPRAYEQVTPVDQHGAPVNGTTHFWAAEDGSWYVTGAGAAEPDGTSSQLWQHFLSRRGLSGWSDWTQIDPPRSNDILTTEATTAGVSEDGTHALVVSNRVLDQGGYDGGGNLYVYDIDSGEYTFVGGSSDFTAYTLLAGIQALPKIFVWASPDFSSLVFRSAPPLLPGVTGTQLYRWNKSAGLELESVMPDGEPPLGIISEASAAAGTRRQVSDDGSVSYFSITAGPDFGVYRRSGGQTTPISVVEGDANHTPQFGQIEAVSRDGRYAVFISGVPLSSDAPEDGSALLYRYDSVTEDLTYLHRVHFDTSAVHAISDDAQTAYFFDGADLIVARGDEIRNLGPDGSDNIGVMSPSGRYYAWGHEGKIMLYDAETDTADCVSCLADGSAGGTPYLLNTGRKPGNRAPRLVLDNGTVVFGTKNQLVTQDQNASFDVYAYQLGRVTLISPGDGPYDALITEVSADARDIFFTTDEALVSQDTNRVSDVYDARIGGGFAEPAPAPTCEGEACKGTSAGPPAVPNLGSFASGNKRGANGAAATVGVRKLTAADRATLARGGKAHLKVKVGGPGKVTVTGKASGSAMAKKAGVVSVPLSLSKGALSELRAKGSLPLSLTVHFQDAKPKVVSVTLRSTSFKKGGSR
jgi:hypothetical protein